MTCLAPAGACSSENDEVTFHHRAQPSSPFEGARTTEVRPSSWVVGVAVRWQLAPSHPLTLGEKAHALFYPPSSPSFSFFLSFSFSFGHEFSFNFSKLFVLFALVEARSSFIQPASFIQQAFPLSLSLIFHPLLLFAHTLNYSRCSDVDLTPSPLRIPARFSLLHSKLIYPFSDVYT